MIRKAIQFSIYLLLFLVIAFGIQTITMHHFEYNTEGILLIPAYITNYFLVLISYAIILFFFKKQNYSLAFIFMAGFLLKMAVFIIFFRPTYQESGDIDGIEFFAFFIPYLICLFTETASLVKILNRS